MFHCHIEFHVELGMALLFKVGSHSDFPPVPAGFPKCGNYLPPLPDISSSTKLQKENEVNFGQTWEYNSTTKSDNGKPGVISITSWWPLHQDSVSFATTNHSINNNLIVINLFLLWWFVSKIYSRFCLVS